MIAPPTLFDLVYRAGTRLMCANCGQPYYVVRDRPGRRKAALCTSCRGEVGVKTVQSRFTTPEGDKALRIRANGLVNKRLKMGWFAKPTTCMKCGKSGRRLDSHHTDYSKPDEVHWLCRSDHVKSHTTPGFLDGIAPFICDDKRTCLPHPRPGILAGLVQHIPTAAEFAAQRSAVTA